MNSIIRAFRDFFRGRRKQNAQRLMHAQHDPAEFNVLIKFINPDGSSNSHAVALLDTQCSDGIWISQRLVNEMGMLGFVTHGADLPDFTSASGDGVTPSGIINLTWIWHDPPGTQVFKTPFFVFHTLDSVDVIVGRDFIQDHGLVKVKRKHFCILLPYKKTKKEGE